MRRFAHRWRMVGHPKTVAISGDQVTAIINGKEQIIQAGERLIDLINRCEIEVPQVCYHPQIGSIRTCDTCVVEVNDKLVRACATLVEDGMNVVTSSERADAARSEAFDRLLGDHLLYCSVNDNGRCAGGTTTGLRRFAHREIPHTPKPFEADISNPVYRYHRGRYIKVWHC